MTISPDIQGQIDGSVAKHILAHLPELPVGIVPISFFPNFVFKQPATSKYVLVDFMENHAPSEEYNKFWKWVADNPPILIFKRELLKQDVSPILKPIEWSCYLNIPERSTREQFNSRPLEVLYFWGYSNQQRPILHGQIFSEGMAKHGLNITSEWNMPIKGDKNWASIYTPHFYRKPMYEVVEEMRLAKITVSMPGNGRKSFRDTECVGTLMALHKTDLAWSYPWDETNSIQLEPGNEFKSLLEATRRTDLYDLYCACYENMRRYEARTYARDYVLAEIQKVI